MIKVDRLPEEYINAVEESMYMPDRMIQAIKDAQQQQDHYLYLTKKGFEVLQEPVDINVGLPFTEEMFNFYKDQNDFENEIGDYIKSLDPKQFILRLKPEKDSDDERKETYLHAVLDGLSQKYKATIVLKTAKHLSKIGEINEVDVLLNTKLVSLEPKNINTFDDVVTAVTTLETIRTELHQYDNLIEHQENVLAKQFDDVDDYKAAISNIDLTDFEKELTNQKETLKELKNTLNEKKSAYEKAGIAIAKHTSYNQALDFTQIAKSITDIEKNLTKLKKLFERPERLDAAVDNQFENIKRKLESTHRQLLQLGIYSPLVFAKEKSIRSFMAELDQYSKINENMWIMRMSTGWHPHVSPYAAKGILNHESNGMYLIHPSDKQGCVMVSIKDNTGQIQQTNYEITDDGFKNLNTNETISALSIDIDELIKKNEAIPYGAKSFQEEHLFWNCSDSSFVPSSASIFCEKPNKYFIKINDQGKIIDYPITFDSKGLKCSVKGSTYTADSIQDLGQQLNVTLSYDKKPRTIEEVYHQEIFYDIKDKPGFFKISRIKHPFLEHSYFVNNERKFIRQLHKSSITLPDGTVSKPDYDVRLIGKGGVKSAIFVKDVSPNATENYVRAVVHKEQADKIDTEHAKKLVELFGKDENIIIGDYVNYKSEDSGNDKHLWLTPLMSTDLDNYAKRSDVTLDAKATAILQVARGLKSLHDKDWVHLDIKPGNCFVNFKDENPNDVRAKLADLDGVVHLEKDTKVPIVGTQLYDAPEKLKFRVNPGVDQAKAIDIFALGASLFELKTGKEPNMSFYANVVEMKKGNLQANVLWTKTFGQTGHIDVRKLDEVDRLIWAMINPLAKSRPPVDVVITYLEAHLGLRDKSELSVNGTKISTQSN